MYNVAKTYEYRFQNCNNWMSSLKIGNNKTVDIKELESYTKLQIFCININQSTSMIELNELKTLTQLEVLYIGYCENYFFLNRDNFNDLDILYICDDIKLKEFNKIIE